MSIYLVIGIVVHLRKFNRNQFRVLFAWFDFIHRCFFHSRWSCTNQAKVIPALDLHTSFHSTSFNDHCIFNAYSVCSKHHIILLWSLIEDPISDWPWFYYYNQINLARIFQSYVISMFRNKNIYWWAREDWNWYNRVEFDSISIKKCVILDQSLDSEPLNRDYQLNQLDCTK